MADRSGKPRYEDRISNSNMAISEAETSTVPVLLKESDIPEASLAGREPAELGKTNILFWQLFKPDRESTARKTTVCFLMFTSNDTCCLATTTKPNVNLECFSFFRRTAVISY